MCTCKRAKGSEKFKTRIKFTSSREFSTKSTHFQETNDSECVQQL